jgi:methylamine dehydrogenase accessory protein MauD
MNWSTVFYLSYIVLWIVVVVQIVLTLSLARLVGQLSRRFPPSGALLVDPGPDIGEIISGNWDASDLYDQPAQISFPRARDLFFYYLSPHCTSCNKLMPAAKSFFQEISAQADTVIVLVHGSPEMQRQYVQAQDLNRYLVLHESALPVTWRVGGAPFGVWVASNGTIKSKGLINLREHLESLWRAANIQVTKLDSATVDTKHEFNPAASNGSPEGNEVVSR